MAEYHVVWTETFQVQSGFASGAQYHIARLAAANLVNVASLKTDSAMVGVTLTKPGNPGENVTVMFEGIAKVTAGGTLTANALLTTDGSGRAVAAGSGDMVFGRALTAGASGNVVSAIIFPPVRWAGAI